MRITVELEAGDHLITLEEMRRRVDVAYLRFAVERVGHRGAAASMLGITRKNLWELLKKFGLAKLPRLAPGIRQQAKASGISLQEAIDLRRVTTTSVSVNIAA